MKKALVLGAGGFIGSHLVKKLKDQGYWVRGVDMKKPEYRETYADEFLLYDLRDEKKVSLAMFSPNQGSIDNTEDSFDEVYQLAADMGGAGYVFTGENDSDIISNSLQINLNVVRQASKLNVKKILFTSSACIYPFFNQEDEDTPTCTEDSAYPAYPDSIYGWEKLISEKLYQSFFNNKNLNIRIARLHNVYGPYGTFEGGREKAPAALMRKVAEAKQGDHIEVWGDGSQTRSFLYIDDCIQRLRMLMKSNIKEPVNIGSDYKISINKLAELIISISNKKIFIKNIDGPVGVRGRVSDNNLFDKKVGNNELTPLTDGLDKTFQWINNEVVNKLVK